MESKTAYKEKFEAQLKQARVKLRTLKIASKKVTNDAKVALSQQIEDLEHGISDAKLKLRDLASAGEERWADIKVGVEGAWAKASDAVRNHATSQPARGENGKSAADETPASTAEKETATHQYARIAIELDGVNQEVLHELIRRTQDIDNLYREMAEKMGQLYLRADLNKVPSLTRGLDLLMQLAANSERIVAAVLEEMHLCAKRHK